MAALRGGEALLRLAAAVFLLMAVAMPVGALLLQLGALRWQELPSMFNLALDGAALLNSALLCLGVLAVTNLFGVPLGVALARVRLPGWVAMGVRLPYVIPPYVSTIAWIQLANPTNGFLTGLLPLNIYSLWGMIWVLGLHLTPFVALSVQDALNRVPASMEEAARVAGAGRREILRDITLPMALPALLASAGFVLASAAASFGVPYLLSASSSSPDPVLTTRIYQALELSPATGRPQAVLLALLLLVPGVGAPLLFRWMQGRRGFSVPAGGRAVEPVALPAAAAGVGLYVAVAALLPLIAVVIGSFTLRLGAGIGPSNLGLKPWIDLLSDGRLHRALLHSTILATAAATAACGAGLVLGWLAQRRGTALDRGIAAAARLPFLIPGSVLGLGLLLCWSQDIRFVLLDRVSLILSLPDTLWLLGLAYTARFVALPLDGARAALQSMHPSLEEAARISGAGTGGVLRDVTLPILMPALQSAWFLVFVPCFCELTLSVLLKGPETEVLGTLLFYLQSYADPSAAAVLAVLVVAVMGIGAAALWLAGRNRGAT